MSKKIAYKWSIDQDLLVQVLQSVWNHEATPLAIIHELHRCSEGPTYFTLNESGELVATTEEEVFTPSDFDTIPLDW